MVVLDVAQLARHVDLAQRKPLILVQGAVRARLAEIKVEFKNVYMGTVRGEPALCIKLCTFQPDIPGLECQNFPGGRFTETPAGVMSA